jgi:hypothetical protein
LNKERPNPADLEAFRKLLKEHDGLQLWRRVAGIAQMSETVALEQAAIPAGLKELWERRLKDLRVDHGYNDAPIMEQLLIHQVVLCWLRLNLTEISYSSIVSQSVTLTKAMFWEKRLSAVQKRYTRACETLARIWKLSRNTPTLQVNIAAEGGQQVNVAPCP